MGHFRGSHSRLPARGLLSVVLATVAAFGLMLSSPGAQGETQSRQTGPGRQTTGRAVLRSQLASPDAAVSAARPSVDPQHLENLRRAALENSDYVPGELVVKFRDDYEPAEAARALRVLGSDLTGSARADWIGDVLHLKSKTIDDPVQAAYALERQPEVLYAHPNYLLYPFSVPNDPGYSDQWNMDAINMPQAWEINEGARDVVVAVVDSGLSTSDETRAFWLWADFAFFRFSIPFGKAVDFDHGRVLAGRDFLFGWTTLFDATGHGTHVAGTIVQHTNNSTGYAGIANLARLLPVKVCGGYWDLQLDWGDRGVQGYAPADWRGCPTTAVVSGFRWAVDQGARVLNLSIGGTSPSPMYREALEYAVQHGAFVAIAAGNSGDEGNPTIYPAAYASEIDGVASVGAVGRSLERASYSSYGHYIELVAPGGDGEGHPSSNRVWQMTPRAADLSPLLYSPRFDRFEGAPKAGTSMASPHVAGVAALLYSQGVRNPAAIEAALKNFARDLGPAGRDDEYGYGLIDARATLRGLGVGR